MKKSISIIIGIVVIGTVIIYLLNNSTTQVVNTTPEKPVVTVPTKPVTTEATTSQEGTTEEEQADATKTVIGSSVEGRKITAYHFGTGDKEVLFVGGIHGGYEWNTILVAYQLMDYLEANPAAIPSNVKVTVIPTLNPDGLNKVVGTDGRFAAADVPTVASQVISGRFNANNVDLNRNFDCDWQATGKWQNTNVSGGTQVFSEPESQAIKKYVEAHKLSGAVVWYSAAGGVYASNCHNEVLPETKQLTEIYAKASGYPAKESFDFYAITGDMVNWLAKNKIPAISVLLTTHEDTEWSKNQAGVAALLKHFAQ